MKRTRMVSLRLVRERTIAYQTREIDSSRAIYDLFRGMAEDLDREAMWVACLDAKNYVNLPLAGCAGNASGRPGSSREVFKIVSFPPETGPRHMRV